MNDEDTTQRDFLAALRAEESEIISAMATRQTSAQCSDDVPTLSVQNTDGVTVATADPARIDGIRRDHPHDPQWCDRAWLCQRVRELEHRLQGMTRERDDQVRRKRVPRAKLKSVAPSPWTYDDENAEIVDGNDGLIADVLELRDDRHATGKLMAAAYLLPECVQALREQVELSEALCVPGTLKRIDPDATLVTIRRARALLAQIEQALP